MAVVNTGNLIDDGVKNIINTIIAHKTDIFTGELAAIKDTNIFPNEVLYVPETPAISVEWAELSNRANVAINAPEANHDITNIFNIVFYQEEMSENILFEKMRQNVFSIMNLLFTYPTLDGYVHDGRTSVLSAVPGVRVSRSNGQFYCGVINYSIIKRLKVSTRR